jgi:hypothetical protein
MQRSPEKTHGQVSAGGTAPAPAKPEEKKSKKFNNGWTRQLETLVAEWADKASCYRWMHEKTESKFSSYNMYFTIPVIVFSTLTGTANFGVDSLLPDPSYGKYASAVIGGVSLLTGIISTIANFLRYAQESEANRVAAISWGKFQRLISIELSLHPNERMDAMSFLKMGRVELDRLVEQSPSIPDKIIKAFDHEFKKRPDVIRPEIAGGIAHTKIFDDRDSRMAKIAMEATFMLQQKKNYMRRLIEEDFDKHITQRTQEERDSMEKEMMEEVSRIARETTEAALAKRLPAVKPATPEVTNVVVSQIQRSPPKVPANKVNNARATFERSASVGRPMSLASLAKQAAAVGAAAAAAAKMERAPSPSSVRLEIIDESASPEKPATPFPSPVSVTKNETPVLGKKSPVSQSPTLSIDRAH